MEGERTTAQKTSTFTLSDFSDELSFTQIFAIELNDFFTWWYIKMPILYLTFLKRAAIVIDDNMSISLMASSFHIPWRRDSTIFGYLIGITLRVLYLPVALIAFVLTMALILLFILFWMLIPIVTIVFICLTPFIRP